MAEPIPLLREMRGGEPSDLTAFLDAVRLPPSAQVGPSQLRAAFGEAFMSEEARAGYLAALDRFTPLPLETYVLLRESSDWKLSFSHVGRGICSVRRFQVGERVAAAAAVATIDSALLLEARMVQGNEEDSMLGAVLNNLIQVDDERYLVASGITALLNHSCEPNVAFVPEGAAFAFRALRNIEPGEELTYDYSSVIGDCFLMECECRSERCRFFAGRPMIFSDEARALFLRRYPPGYLLDFALRDAQKQYTPVLNPPDLVAHFFEGANLSALIERSEQLAPEFRVHLREHLCAPLPS